MTLRFRSVAVAVVTAGYAHTAFAGDEKSAPLLISALPPSAMARPLLVSAPAPGTKPAPTLASFFPLLPSSYFANAEGSSKLLFLSPLSPLRAALRVAAQDLAVQTLTAFDSATAPSSTAASDDDEPDVTTSSASARRREVLLRQRRRSVLNDRNRADERSSVASALDSDFEMSGLNGRVELRTLPAGPVSGEVDDSALPGGAGFVRVSGNLTEDLSFALTGLAAESAATTWRAGAEFEFAEGDRNITEIGAVYGTRFNAARVPFGGEVDRRSVGAFRLVHAVKFFDGVTARAGGRFIDAPFLRTSRSMDPELSILLENPEGTQGARSYLRFHVSGDTLFPGLEVVTNESDIIALSEGLPLIARNFEPQRTWTRGAAIGYRHSGTRIEARLQDQTFTHALVVVPSSLSGAPFVWNGDRSRAQMGSMMVETTFARGQALAGVEYGFGRFGADGRPIDRARSFHQITTRFDAYLRRTGTGLAVFHRVHEGAFVANQDGGFHARQHAQRYLVELRQDVPFVPAMIGADMALLVSLRNVYYDDVDRRNIDEFAVSAPPRRITGGIRVKF